ncbi:hypothetical protein CDL12_01904 [Handroanthus impetiginosus]|uniref:Endonuclease/exonuclease/phosphatase domain-containing protein n=1 Tax=Handroanthus impetiginosus TaxID=429701 RepID=A0A2G9I6G9_9LAMI|nr:hypothetical protein CDL12_01904 [Handroanthus impetiginosus]
MTNYLIWNIKGLGTVPFKEWFTNLLRTILEAKVQLDKKNFTIRLGFSDIVNNCSNHIWLFKHTSTATCGDQRCLFANTYHDFYCLSQCTRIGRRPLWSDLKSIGQHTISWSIAGDFNIILEESEDKSSTYI